MRAIADSPLAPEAPALSVIGRQIAFASGAPGVGKTHLALALAGALARRGERVLLFELSDGAASAHAETGLAPGGDLAGVVSGAARLDEAVAPVQGGADGGGFDLIVAAAGQPAESAAFESAELAAGLAAAALVYDFVILDLIAGADAMTTRFAAAADHIFVVVSDQPPAVTDGYALIKHLRARDPERAPAVVVNIAATPDSARAAHDTLARTCETFLGFTPALAGAALRARGEEAAERLADTILESG
ncbi:MAG: hypothetical protein MI723_10760 [Caulobacterales bacterium]|nr:hypothetical protein [Caulobacterales bacterium]